MTDGRLSQLDVMLVAQVVAEEARASELDVMLLGAFPSEEGRVSEVDAMLPLETGMNAEVSQLQALVVGRGRVANPSLKVWQFPLDSHNFYVLNLGDIETLVFDKLTKKWSVWGSGQGPRWRLSCGVSWLGAGANASVLGSSIVAGDDTYGVLYFLDPKYPFEDDPITGTEGAAPFYRAAQGQIPARGNAPIDCYSVRLTGSFGDVYVESLTAVTLSYSDDAGRNYVNAGTLDITVDDYAARAEWRSLGMVRSPGRLFLIEDDGALARIDGLDLADG